jgi:anti-anti-sigma factor
VIGVEVQQIDNVLVARPRGDIDAATTARVREQLTDSMGNNVECLVVDLSQTRYVDSAGIDMLFRLSERLRERRAKLLLVIPRSSQLLRLAVLVGLTRVMPVCETLEEALARRDQSSGAARQTGSAADH